MEKIGVDGEEVGVFLFPFLYYGILRSFSPFTFKKFIMNNTASNVFTLF